MIKTIKEVTGGILQTGALKAKVLGLETYLKFQGHVQEYAMDKAREEYRKRLKEYRYAKENEFTELQHSKDRILNSMDVRIRFMEYAWKYARKYMDEEAANGCLREAAKDAGVGITIERDHVVISEGDMIQTEDCNLLGFLEMAQ